MKKLAALVLSGVLGMIVLTGCTTSMSYSYKVGTGDNVKVELDTSDGLMLENGLESGDEGFRVTEDDETILQGVFVDEDTYDLYMEIVKYADGVEVVEEDSANGLTWVLYEFDGNAGMESNYIVWIDGSDTGIIMGSLEGTRAAKKAFNSLTFTVD
ncbi:MAG: hypothetical protein K2K96_12115 [Lachnospiraceae bacterium]|nr:hypothetical protein [Lachnospiraceae bacterium]